MYVIDMNKLKIGLDIDGTITDYPAFFAIISKIDQFEIHIITGRGEDDRQSTIEELAQYGVRYDYLHFVDVNWHGKGQICKDYNIDFMFDDMDEYINNIPVSTAVFKVRNEGNWNTLSNKWYE